MNTMQNRYGVQLVQKNVGCHRPRLRAAGGERHGIQAWRFRQRMKPRPPMPLSSRAPAAGSGTDAASIRTVPSPLGRLLQHTIQTKNVNYS